MKSLRILLLVTVALVTVLATGVTRAHAIVVGNPPTYPITITTSGPPPIPALPVASDTAPPPEEITDPVTAAASCVPWYQQSTYGQQWPATSTWWEYRCSYENDYYSNPCTSGACNAFCWYCYWETQVWTDYFYWDGSNATFYGEAYSDNLVWEGDLAPPSSTTGWWDAATSAWYALAPTLSVSTAGRGAGEVSSDPAGIACGATCHTTFDPGSTVTLTASPDTNSVFAGWSGDCTGTGACQVTIDQSHSVQATFEPKVFQLTVATAGPGHGLVYMDPGATGCDGCREPYDSGTQVTLTPSPDPGSVFTGWSGDCTGTGACQVTIDQARSVTASFAPETFDLRVGLQGNGSGQVSSDPAAIACGTTCQASFAPGRTVTLTANATTGSVFTGWLGDCFGTGSCQVTMTQTRSVTAQFALNAPPHASLTLACTGRSCSFDGSGSVDPDGTVQSYRWDFGDGTTASGSSVSHIYAQPGAYLVALTVIDNGGATGTWSTTVTPISLAARGYKLNGLEKANLSWSGSNSTRFGIYRNGALVAASVPANAYTDNINRKGPGTYLYRVCEAAIPVCSSTATVRF